MVAWLLLVVVSAAAQEPIPSRTPIVTDNPTISRSSHAVGRGVVVLEANYAYASTKDGNPPVTSLPFILHVGVTDDLELRAESNGPLWQAEKRGFADLALGFRYEFVPDWTRPRASSLVRRPPCESRLDVAARGRVAPVRHRGRGR